MQPKMTGDIRLVGIDDAGAALELISLDRAYQRIAGFIMLIFSLRTVCLLALVVRNVETSRNIPNSY